MDFIRKYFPLSFKEKRDVAALVITVAIYVIAGVIVSAAMLLLKAIPIVNLTVGLVGLLTDLYITAGIALTFLDYFKVIK